MKQAYAMIFGFRLIALLLAGASAIGCGRARYQIDDDVALDTTLGLLWIRESIMGTWEEAKSHCAKLSLHGYSDWRVPHPGDPDDQKFDTNDTFYFGRDRADECIDSKTDYNYCYDMQSVMEQVFPKIDENRGIWTDAECMDRRSQGDYSSCSGGRFGDGYLLKSDGLAAYLFSDGNASDAALISESHHVLCVRTQDPNLPFGAY